MSRSRKSKVGMSQVLLAGLCLVGVVCAAPPEGKEWVVFEPMTDEFDGDALDRSKWHNHNPQWGGREPTRFHPDCVAVSNGLLHISAFDSVESAKRNPPEGFTHIAGFVKSKARARFGYFEMRAMLMNASQVSGFWLYHAGRDEWSEIDIVEIVGGLPQHESKLRPNTHYFHGPHYRGTPRKHLEDPSTHELGFDTSEDFHLYACEWSPTSIKWYVDGKLIHEKHNGLFFQPLELNMNVEANKWFDALPNDETLPAVYQIDYVRVWRQKEY